jgi:2-dehydropantoate 2-reductase
MLKILVMGAGAIGCFIGGSLAGGGHQVTLVGRPRLMEQIAAAGLVIQWPDQPAQTVFPKTTTGVETTGGGYDFILLTVKSPDTASAAQQLVTGGVLSDQSWLVSFQNGIGNEEQLVEIFSSRPVIAGTLTIPIQSPEPGLIRVSKAKGGIGIAPLTNSQPVRRLAEALHEAGLTTQTYSDYRAMKWSKLMLNIVTNASCAILNQPPLDIIARPELFDLEIAALRECGQVMAAQGIRAVRLPGYPVDWLARLTAAEWLPATLKRAILRPFMASGRGSKMPSLQIDLAAGRSTSEINALNGAIVQAGQRCGVATPVNQTLTKILSGLVAGELNWADYQNQPHKLVEAINAQKA